MLVIPGLGASPRAAIHDRGPDDQFDAQDIEPPQTVKSRGTGAHFAVKARPALKKTVSACRTRQP